MMVQKFTVVRDFFLSLARLLLSKRLLLQKRLVIAQRFNFEPYNQEKLFFSTPATQ